MDGSREIWAATKLYAGQERPVALATLVRVVGSAFRAPGARMLIDPDGRCLGDISGGCLDLDVVERARELTEPGESRLLVYDSASIADLASGFATGCPQRVEILIQRIDSGYGIAGQVMDEWMRTRRSGVLAVVCDVEGIDALRVGGHLHWELDANGPAGLDDPEIRQALGNLAQSMREGQKPGSVEIEVAGGKARLFVQRFLPAPRLLLLGGNDATLLPLVELASMLGWESVCVEGRPESHRTSTSERIRRIDLSPKDLVAELKPDPRSFALVLTHHNQRDQEWIEALLATEVPYIGVMGSRKRLGRLFSTMREEGRGLSADQWERIRGPVGLELGARNAQEIALSVVAEVQGALSGEEPLPKRDSMRFADAAILLLAAGGSSRMGRPKQLLPFGRQSLLRRAAREALATGVRPVVVVLGAQSAVMEKELEGLEVRICENERWEEGMASSITAGIGALQELRPVPAEVLITLCDQPAVSESVLVELLEMHGACSSPITACEYAGQVGVPAVFDQALYAELAQLEGDCGARDLLRGGRWQVERYPFPGGQWDLDEGSEG